MTIQKLYNALQSYIKQGRGRLPLVINKRTFAHPLEQDGCCMLDVENYKVGRHNVLDGDGHCIVNKDGTERQMLAFVLMGDANGEEG